MTTISIDWSAIQSTIYRSCICPDPRSNNISFSPLLMAPCVRESHSRPFTCLLISPDRRVSKIDILQSLRPVPWLGRNKFDAPLPLIRKVEPPLKQRANDSRGCKFLGKIIRLEHVFFNRASPSFWLISPPRIFEHSLFEWMEEFVLVLNFPIFKDLVRMKILQNLNNFPRRFSFLILSFSRRLESKSKNLKIGIWK